MYEVMIIYLFFVLELLLIIYLFAKIIESVNLIAKRRHIEDSISFLNKQVDEIKKVKEKIHDMEVEDE